MRIAIQGELGSFSHEAVSRMLPPGQMPGDRVVIVPCTLSADVFRAVDTQEVDAAVIPIENSLAGSVVEHYDLLLQYDVIAQQECLLHIVHNLIGLHGASVPRLHRVFSHPIALAQCRRFLNANPHIEAVPFYDTAGSVKQVVESRDRHLAAIASTQAAREYGAEIIAPGIQDNPENYTRFLLIRRVDHCTLDPAANKVSFAFIVENRPGTLVAALGILAALGINLTKLESRPVHGKPWQYVFYADFQMLTPTLADTALAALRSHCSMVKQLGRYRAAATPSPSPAASVLPPPN